MVAFRALLGALLLVCCLSFSQATETRGQVVKLDTAAFERMVPLTGKQQGWFVDFYAPWCGHCEALEPKWAQAAEENDEPKLVLASVDATVESELAVRFNITGLPTIILFYNGEAIQYKGAREAVNILKFGKNAVNDIIDNKYAIRSSIPAKRKPQASDMLNTPPIKVALFALVGFVIGGSLVWLVFRPRGSLEDFKINETIDRVEKKAKEAAAVDNSVGSEAESPQDGGSKEKEEEKKKDK
mmetsp:Transcript_22262/g.41742  ORF Transcript_22262/g.41742 Transcript_22262/m.41742 type:complete len:242 (-) Transcript_22262:126-851(-)